MDYLYNLEGQRDTQGDGGGIKKLLLFLPLMSMLKASPSNNYHYNKDLNPLAKVLKQQMTKSEACMWKYLLSTKQFHGFSFRRQRPILNYIVDFCCLELMLIIEVESITHTTEEASEKDAQRDTKLIEIGFKVFRFSSWEVLNRMVDVDVILTKWMLDNNFNVE